MVVPCHVKQRVVSAVRMGNGNCPIVQRSQFRVREEGLILRAVAPAGPCDIEDIRSSGRDSHTVGRVIERETAAPQHEPHAGMVPPDDQADHLDEGRQVILCYRGAMTRRPSAWAALLMRVSYVTTAAKSLPRLRTAARWMASSDPTMDGSIAAARSRDRHPFE